MNKSQSLLASLATPSVRILKTSLVRLYCTCLRSIAAAKDFAREELGLKHRYAMVLHTDEPHPHVHMVVKAVSEQGVRLNIRKATLREWRRKFARHLRAYGVDGNANRASRS